MEREPGGLQCGRAGHAGKSSPPCAPQPEPGPSSPQPRSGVASQAGTPVSASPHPSSAKKALSSAAPPYRTRSPASATTDPPSFPNPGSGPAAVLCLPLAPAPVGLGLSRGSINPAPGAGRGLWGSRLRCAFGFQVNGTSRKNAPGPPHSSPTAEGLHPRGAAAPDGDLPRLTCGWARGAPPAPLPRRWATLGSSPRRRGGGEAVSPGAQNTAPSR